MIYAIDVNFDSIFIDDFMAIAYQAYGQYGWDKEQDQNFIGLEADAANGKDEYKKKRAPIDRHIYSKSTTQCTYQIVEFDRIFDHAMAGPLYQGSMEIKEVEKGF